MNVLFLPNYINIDARVIIHASLDRKGGGTKGKSHGFKSIKAKGASFYLQREEITRCLIRGNDVNTKVCERR
jgi:hypothetical protein